MSDLAKILIEKIREARKSRVTVEGREFQFSRPTAADAAQMRGLNDVQICQRFVTGWDLTELDLIPGGGAQPVPFNAELFSVWIEDHPEYWTGISGAILDAFLKYRNEQKDAEKN